MTNNCKACTPGNFRTMSPHGDITSFYGAEQSISNIYEIHISAFKPSGRWCGLRPLQASHGNPDFCFKNVKPNQRVSGNNFLFLIDNMQQTLLIELNLYWTLNLILILPGENMAGARPPTASCLRREKSAIFQMNTPSYVQNCSSRKDWSDSANCRSRMVKVRSSCRTFKSHQTQKKNRVMELTNSNVVVIT